MVWKKHKKLFLILAAVVVVLAIAVPLTVLAVSRAFTAQESAVRTDWGDADVGGEVVERDEALQIGLYLLPEQQDQVLCAAIAALQS